jgi:hypothetical protein
MSKAMADAWAYAAADKYDIPSLMAFSKLQFVTNVKICSVEELAKVTELVYTSTPSTNRGLREIVVQTKSLEEYLLFIKSAERWAKPFQEMLEQTGEFGRDLLLQVEKRTRHVDKYTCSCCQAVIVRDMPSVWPNSCVCRRNNLEFTKKQVRMLE